MIAKSDEHGIDEQMTKNRETRKATHFHPTSSHFTSPFANHFGTHKFPSNVAIPTWAIQIQSSMIEWAKGTIFLVNKTSSPTCRPFEFIYFDSSSALKPSSDFCFGNLPRILQQTAWGRLAKYLSTTKRPGRSVRWCKKKKMWWSYSSNQHGKITKSRENSSECEPAIIRLWHRR